MKLLDTFTSKIVRAGYIDGTYVEYLPFLKHIPAWLAPWKKEALVWGPRFTKLFGDLFTRARDRAINGESSQTISAMMIENQVRYNLSVQEAGWLVGTVASGFETMAGTMAWWALEMVLYPEVQKKAQAEVDAVVGRSRLPSMADFDQLVYVKAMLKEVLRWHTVGPLGVQRRSVEDDVHEGCQIPKGTICIANIWGINRDQAIWGPDADDSNPERYMDVRGGKLSSAMADTKEEGHVSFGFGRRICVGRHVAHDSLLLNMASIL